MEDYLYHIVKLKEYVKKNNEYVNICRNQGYMKSPKTDVNNQLDNMHAQIKTHQECMQGIVCIANSNTELSRDHY